MGFPKGYVEKAEETKKAQAPKTTKPKSKPKPKE